jgi:CBS domain-containing protein
MNTGFVVSDCMTLHPITVGKDTSAADCAKLMADKHVGSILVTEGRKVIGILTEQDLVRKGLAKGINPVLTKVSELMIPEKNMVTVSPGKDIYDALKLMRDFNIRHLPVIEEGRFMGFLTIKDILKIQPQLFELIVEKYEIRESSRKPLAYQEFEGVCDECKTPAEDLIDVEGSLLCPACRQEEE